MSSAKRQAGTAVGLVPMTAPKHEAADLGPTAGRWARELAVRRAKPEPTACKRGHAYDAENVRRTGGRMQECPRCLADWSRTSKWLPAQLTDEQRGDPALARPAYRGPVDGRCEVFPVDEITHLIVFGELGFDGKVWYPTYRALARRVGCSESKLARLAGPLNLIARRNAEVAAYQERKKR